ncbi:MAG TPA: hypothetical protein EYP56_22360, partial [Planctomycetaceae bacterium]|nr:hypothetical protein [Planctomycetaceae bacterium]
ISMWIAGTLVAGALAASSASARGQTAVFPGSDPAYAIQAPAHQLVSSSSYASLESRLSALEAKLADEQGGQGELDWHDTSDDRLTHTWGGRIFGDYVLFSHQDAASVTAFGDQEDYFQFRSIRIFAQGEGYGVFDYKLEFDFEPEFVGRVVEFDGVAIKDLYVGIHEVPLLGYVRFGNFKEPFSLEHLTNANFITFLERALPSIFVPGRYVGVCAYNHTADEQFTIAYGAFFNDVDEILKERKSDRQGIDIPIRITWNPIYQAGGRGVLHFGFGYVWADDRDDSVRFRATPEVHGGDHFVDTDLLPISDYHRLGGEVAVVYGPWSIQSELFYVDADGVGGFQDQTYYGAYVFGSWFLTGEHRVYKRTTAAFGRVRPNTNFWIVRTVDRGVDCGWGAWELAVRWSYLDLTIDGIPLGQRDDNNGMINDLTVGVNWYWNPHMRVMFNYIHSWGSVVGTIGLVDDVADTDILAMRMQVDF